MATIINTNADDGEVGILVASEQTTNKIYLVQQKNQTYLQFITVVNDSTYIWKNIGTLSASEGGVPPEFSYNENNLNILLAEISNTIFNYDEGNLICSFQ